MKNYLYEKYVSSGQAGDAKNETGKQAYFDFLYKCIFAGQARDINILDVGCGSGPLLMYLQEKKFTNLYGVDISEEQIELAKQKNLRNIVQGDLIEYTKKGANAFFDVIIAKDILEHLTLEELFTLGKELKRILKKEGTIVGHVPNANGIFGMKIKYGDLTHVHAFNEKSLNQLFRTFGFDQIRVIEDKPKSASFIKSIIRRLLWELLTFQFRIINYIESGERYVALSCNITFFVS
jgi:2-polyprenyl-3-methyl-5-hydroxy-6-metoxy-1,4-benzoquinol methylase